MNILLILAIVALLFFWVLGRFSRTQPSVIARLLRRVAGGLLVALGGFLSWRGMNVIGAPLVAFGLGMLGFAQFSRQDASGPHKSNAGMSREQAYAILGLEPGASESEIKAAHRRLMKLHHPDIGGDAKYAARLNAAKQKLIG